MSQTLSIKQLKAASLSAEKAFATVETFDELQAFSAETIGKHSPLGDWFKALKALDDDTKKELGPAIQEYKNVWEAACRSKQAALETAALNAKLKEDRLDVTQSYPTQTGSIHPLNQVQRHIEGIFTSMGFEIADGPEVETEWHNFEALNIPATHPARDMQDTFFVSSKSDNAHHNSVLRTHTSNLQIRKMLEKGAPIRVIAPGRVFRNESIDATHDAMFYQVEGLVVDKDISVAHLKGTLETMLSAVFNKAMKIRIRPGYFPFVEPGLEVDIWWEYTDKNGEQKGRWLEFCGAGMVHPNVLRNSNVDPEKYSGFAFGFGLTRLVMMKYGIEDIRLLSSNKKEFLQQF